MGKDILNASKILRCNILSGIDTPSLFIPLIPQAPPPGTDKGNCRLFAVLSCQKAPITFAGPGSVDVSCMTNADLTE